MMSEKFTIMCAPCQITHTALSVSLSPFATGAESKIILTFTQTKAKSNDKKVKGLK